MTFAPTFRLALLAAMVVGFATAGCNSVPVRTDTPNAPTSGSLPSSDSGSASTGSGSPKPDDNSSGDNGSSQPEPEPVPGPTKSQLNDATYPIAAFEKRVERANGRVIKPDHNIADAQRRIDAMRAEFPDHPDVLALQKRLDDVLIAARGSEIEVTPDLLAYRQVEQRVVASVAQKTKQAWDEWRHQLTSEGAVTDAFPAPNPEEDPDVLMGKVVIIENALRYPYNLFGQLGEAWLFCGGDDRGIYYIPGRERAFLDLYETLRRYRGAVSQNLPQPWTVVGRVTDLALLTPVAGELADHARPQAGWVIEPLALVSPGRCMAWFPPDEPDGEATFVGEDEIETILARWYTVKDVADDATAQQVVEAYIAVVKEKNHALYRKLLHPANTANEGALNATRNAWQRAQEAFTERYVHARVQRMEAKPGEMTAWIELFNAEGKLARSVYAMTLRQDDDGRWRLYSGMGF